PRTLDRRRDTSRRRGRRARALGPGSAPRGPDRLEGPRHEGHRDREPWMLQGGGARGTFYHVGALRGTRSVDPRALPRRAEALLATGRAPEPAGVVDDLDVDP